MEKQCFFLHCVSLHWTCRLKLDPWGKPQLWVSVCAVEDKHFRTPNMEALFGFSSLCMFSHWSHPEDAVALPLALVRVDCHGSEARHLGDCLAEQISAEFTLYKHYHWRLVQLTILKSDKIFFFLTFYIFSIQKYCQKSYTTNTLCILCACRGIYISGYIPALQQVTVT